MRYLESLPPKSRLGGVVLAAGFTRPLETHPQLDSFTDQPLDFGKCRQVANRIIAINSDDDPYVPLEEGEIIRDQLGADLIVYPHGGHLNEKSGLTEFPLLLEELSAVMQEE